MGEVFLGEVSGAANFTKRVAIKRILPHLAQNEDFLHKFIDEAHLMVQLHHGNIVPVLELGDEEGELYLVMEYLPGRDLKAVLKRSRTREAPCPDDLALWIVAEICAGLDYAHRKVAPDGAPLHIVHRDVSPSNVVIGAGGEVKLVDFGIARARGSLHQSISGTLQGKFAYMSPEQADGRALGPQSDVFSAGVVLYEMLTGVRPLEGESEPETLRRVREAKVEPPSSVRPGLSPAVDALVLRALARDLDDRFESAADMRRAIQQHLAGRESGADAAMLSGWLKRLFPEGVVPDASSDGPLSLEDAMLAELGGLSGGSARTRTQTLTADDDPDAAVAVAHTLDSPVGTLAPTLAPTRGARAAAPLAEPVAAPSGTSAPTPPERGPIRGVRRALTVALIGVTGLLVYTQTPTARPIEVRIAPEEAAVSRLTVDGVTTAAEGLEAEVGARICVEATGFQGPVCRRVPARGALPVFELKREMREVRFGVSNVEGAMVRVNGGPPSPEDSPFRLAVTEPVEVTYLADGHAPRTERYDLMGGQTAFLVRLEPVPAPAEGPKAEGASSSAEPDRPATDPVPSPAATKPKRAPARVALQSEPPGATVRCDGVYVGLTPARVPPGRCSVALDGHATAELTVRAGDRARSVSLRKVEPGFLTVATFPYSTKVYVDGHLLGDRVFKRALPPGTYVVEGRHAVHPNMERQVRVEPGKEARIQLYLRTPPEDPL